MVSDLTGYLIGGIGGLITAIAAVWYAFSQGKSSGKNEQQAKQSKQVLERVGDAQKSKRDSDNLTDDEAIERMRERARK